MLPRYLYMAISFYKWEGFDQPEVIFSSLEELKIWAETNDNTYTEYYRVEILGDGKCVYERVYP